MNLLQKILQKISSFFLIITGLFSLIYFLFRKSPHKEINLKSVTPLKDKKEENHKNVINKTDNDILNDLKDL